MAILPRHLQILFQSFNLSVRFRTTYKKEEKETNYAYINLGNDITVSTNCHSDDHREEESR